MNTAHQASHTPKPQGQKPAPAGHAPAHGHGRPWPTPPATSQPAPTPLPATSQAAPALPPPDPSTIAWIDAAIRKGDHYETPLGPLPLPPPSLQLPSPPIEPGELLLHEKDLLASVLPGDEDHTARWGIFRRRIGLRFNEAVPDSLWSTPELRLVAAEVDAIFRGQRDVHTLNANAIRHGLRERSLSGRWDGSLQEMDLALADLLEWGKAASALDFPIACDIFQAAKARQLLYPALTQLLDRRGRDRTITAELQECREALQAAQSIATGRLRNSQPVLSARQTAHQCIALASVPLDQRPKPISTGIPSLDLDMRGGVVTGQGEGTWVLAARSGVGKTTLAIAAAMGLACNGASVLIFSCELTRQAILSRLLAHYCRRAIGHSSPLYSANDLEGRGKVIAGDDLERLLGWHERFEAGLQPDGSPMGEVLYESRFGATVEEFCELVEDTKAAHPALSVVVLDHFHAMGSSPGYGTHTTVELANRAMAIKALAGRCELDILVVAQLNRGAYVSTTGPDVSHLAGTSELERFASAVWLIDRPKPLDGAPPPKGVLEVHHGKFRHGQTSDVDLTRTSIRLDRAHCFLESDEARIAFSGAHLYPHLTQP
jgi:replicative DNA helicase